MAVGPTTNRSSSFAEMEGSHYSVFYKDLKFRKFGGRSKPCKLLAGEEFLLFLLFKKKETVNEENVNTLNEYLHQGRLKELEWLKVGLN